MVAVLGYGPPLGTDVQLKLGAPDAVRLTVLPKQTEGVFAEMVMVGFGLVVISTVL